ncbi:MAG: murein biosynthesis integral membrane protein MurJ [Elusimicrobia bacterium]|nr:murein biosynthesis integral membrane protein MurJ [Elusimicrobiota bacterium]
MISRVLGYARDLSIAYVVGGGSAADVYFASFRVANFLRNLVGEGGLYAAYTPVYSSLSAKDPEDAKNFAHAYAGKLLAALVLIVFMGIIWAAPLSRLLLKGFETDPMRMAWIVDLTKVLMPFLLFVAMAAWAQATLQAHGKFFFSSLSPSLASLAIIVFLHWPGVQSWDLKKLLLGMAWATTIGGALQYVVQLPQLLALIGFHGAKSFWEKHAELKRSLGLLITYMMTFPLDQINSFVATFFGAFGEPGSVSALYNSSRLVQLPLGMIGVGSLITSLPALSRMVGQGQKEALRDNVREQFRRILALEIPIVLVFIIFGHGIIRLLYRHGQFDARALNLTAAVLAASAPSLIFYSLQKVYLGLFYAHQDTKSLVWSSAAQLAVGIASCALAIWRWGTPGIGAAMTLSSIAGFLVMRRLAQRRRYL